jgi:putative transposase
MEKKARGPKPTPIELSRKEREGLEKLVKRHGIGQQKALRARIVLAAADGRNISQTSRDLRVVKDTVRLWRDRWQRLQRIRLKDLSIEERLEDLPRPGAPARINAQQRSQIEALACEKPEEGGRPITHWTPRELADEIIHRGIVDQISPRHAARLLKRRGSQTALDPLLAHVCPRSGL